MPDASPMLQGIRVLDLTDHRAELTGRVLADLGADVLKIEPPEGSPARRIAPFDERPGVAAGHSLYWAALGVGKQSAVLDLEQAADRDTLQQLAQRADILVESSEPGTMERWGLDEARLRAANPRLIYLSVTPYGQQGPKAHWPASELTLEAAGGRLAVQGDRDRPPVPVGYPQAAFHTAARAAADCIIALNERELSGHGQRLDTSMQEGIIWTLMSYTGYPSNTGGDPPGQGDDRGDPNAVRRAQGSGAFACADGHVVMTNTSIRQLMAAMPVSVLPALAAAGALDPTLSAVDYSNWARRLVDGEVSAAEQDLVFGAVKAFFLAHTKVQLMEWARVSDVHLGPVNTTADLLQIDQYQARGFWQQVGEYLHPGPVPRSSRASIEIRGPAPALGQHQTKVSEWLSFPPQPKPPTPADRLGEAFAGVKIADFSWVAVGPMTAKAFADHGATVVRIESETRVDYVRTLVPFKDNKVGINRSHWVNNLNTSKYGAAFNMGTPEGKRLAREVVEWADVVVESFTPGTMKRLGLDYETLSKTKPELIMLSACLYGQTGPWAPFAGYGPHGAAMSGLHGITGWPDRAPCGPVGPYSDVIAPHFGVAALAAAILERRKTGLGQHIDVSQVEAAIRFIEPLVLDQTVNGRTAGRAGHRSWTACPNGVYPTAGTERYLALSVETPEQWNALRRLAPLDAFGDPKFDALTERQALSDAIDAALKPWIAGFERRELETLLVNAGIPASVAQRPTELVADPHLAARGFFVPLTQSEVGTIPYDGFITRFSAKKEMLHKPAPSIGEDTEWVLRQILGYNDDQITEFAIAGALT